MRFRSAAVFGIQAVNEPITVYGDDPYSDIVWSEVRDYDTTSEDLDNDDLFKFPAEQEPEAYIVRDHIYIGTTEEALKHRHEYGYTGNSPVRSERELTAYKFLLVNPKPATSTEISEYS